MAEPPVDESPYHAVVTEIRRLADKGPPTSWAVDRTGLSPSHAVAASARADTAPDGRLGDVLELLAAAPPDLGGWSQ